MTIEEGKTAPQLKLEDADGNCVDLEDLRGRDVVVYFYPRDETPGCTKEACAFRDLFEEFEKLGVVVLGVSPDSVESHRKFADHHRLPFTLLADPDKEVMRRYGAWGEKTMYGKTVQGVIRSTVWIGADGRIRKHWKRVSRAADHPEKVLDEVRAGA